VLVHVCGSGRKRRNKHFLGFPIAMSLTYTLYSFIVNVNHCVAYIGTLNIMLLLCEKKEAFCKI
jgi:hypothetical protein